MEEPHQMVETFPVASTTKEVVVDTFNDSSTAMVVEDDWDGDSEKVQRLDSRESADSENDMSVEVETTDYTSNKTVVETDSDTDTDMPAPQTAAEEQLQIYLKTALAKIASLEDKVLKEESKRLHFEKLYEEEKEVSGNLRVDIEEDDERSSMTMDEEVEKKVQALHIALEEKSTNLTATEEELEAVKQLYEEEKETSSRLSEEIDAKVIYINTQKQQLQKLVSLKDKAAQLQGHFAKVNSAAQEKESRIRMLQSSTKDLTRTVSKKEEELEELRKMYHQEQEATSLLRAEIEKLKTQKQSEQHDGSESSAAAAAVSEEKKEDEIRRKLEHTVGLQAAALADSEAEIESLQDLYREEQEVTSMLKEEVNDQIELMRINDLFLEFIAVEREKGAKLQDEVSKSTATINEQKSKIGKLTEKVGSQHTTIIDQNKRIEEIKRQMTKEHERAVMMHKKLPQLFELLKDEEEKNVSLQERLKKQETQHDAYRAKYRRLEAEVARLEGCLQERMDREAQLKTLLISKNRKRKAFKSVFGSPGNRWFSLSRRKNRLEFDGVKHSQFGADVNDHDSIVLGDI